MTSLDLKFHPAQLKIYNSQARFKVVAAGRRFGKTVLEVGECVVKALTGKEDVFYVAPTFQQAKDIAWGIFKDTVPLSGGLSTAFHENTGVITLLNGRRIHLKGSDRPDTLRGVGLRHVAIDEYASMKASVWEEILRPTLIHSKGSMTAIGTPAGRNHFFDLYNYAASGQDPDWEAFHYTSYDNPFLDPIEIDRAQKSMSSFAFRQEFMASFEGAASDLFKPEWFQVKDEPEEGEYYMSVDLCGFTDIAKQLSAKNKRLDEHAIVIAKCSYKGWWIKEIIHGRWDVRETALRILKAAKSVNCKIVGIEKGSLKNAVMPYLREAMIRTNYHMTLLDTTHGNQKKTERIVWSLQGRLEKGTISLNQGDWNKLLIDQATQFPSPLTHDDLLDALSYLDQVVNFGPDYEEHDPNDDFEILDETVGY